jgi:hypothetical protein
MKVNIEASPNPARNLPKLVSGETSFGSAIFLPPIVSSQTRQGAALSLSVMLWIGILFWIFEFKAASSLDETLFGWKLREPSTKTTINRDHKISHVGDSE